HPAYLALLPFPKYETQLIVVLPGDVRGTQGLAIERQAVVEHRQAIASDLALHANQILFLDLGVLIDQLPGDAAILSQHEQALRVDIESARRSQAPQMRGVEP